MMDLTEKENIVLEEMILGWPEEAAGLWDLYLAIKAGQKRTVADLTDADREYIFILERKDLIEFEEKSFRNKSRILPKPL